MKVLARVLTGTALATGLFSSVLPATSAFADDDKKVRHVLLVSVDGLHAVDLQNYVETHPVSTLAFLLSHG